MGYFKDWQKGRKNIREALNRLPGEQPPQPQFNQSRENIARLEQEADRRNLDEALKWAVETYKKLSYLDGVLENAWLDDEQVNAEELEKLSSQAMNAFQPVYKYLANKKQRLEQGNLSQHFPSQSQLPPPMN